MQPFEIFNATHPWKNCADERPWVVIELRPHGIVGCFPVSGECYDGRCFPIPDTNPDFAATGLKKSSFVHDEYIIELRFIEFRNRRGEIVRDLLNEFRQFTGL